MLKISSGPCLISRKKNYGLCYSPDYTIEVNLNVPLPFWSKKKPTFSSYVVESPYYNNYL